MPVPAASKRVEQAETEIAVLRVRFDNLDEKVDELKIEVKQLHSSMDKGVAENRTMLKEFQDANKKAHEDLGHKISGMEKIKWMLMGAAAVLGATSVQAFKMIIGS